MRSRLFRRLAGSAAAALMASAIPPAPSAAQGGDAPAAEAIYERATAAMHALLMPASLAYDVDISSGSLHADCRAAAHGKFALRFGRGSGRYHVVYVPATDTAESEDARTHEACAGALFAPMAVQRTHRGTTGGNVDMSDIVRAAALDERAEYTMALKTAVPAGDHVDYVLTFSPRRDGGDHDRMLRQMTVDGASWLVKEIRCHAGGSSFAGGARVDFIVSFGPLQRYWVVRDFEMNGDARALFVTKRFDIAAHPINYEVLPARTQEPAAR